MHPHTGSVAEKCDMMESTNSKISVSNTPRQSSKQLLFDRRYGWVIDEWKDPSEEALQGGRGMFCIIPLAKALVQMASQSINLSAVSAIKAFEKPQMLQAALGDGLQNLMSSLKNSSCKHFIASKNFQSCSSKCSSDSQVESNQ